MLMVNFILKLTSLDIKIKYLGTIITTIINKCCYNRIRTRLHKRLSQTRLGYVPLRHVISEQAISGQRRSDSE